MVTSFDLQEERACDVRNALDLLRYMAACDGEVHPNETLIIDELSGSVLEDSSGDPECGQWRAAGADGYELVEALEGASSELKHWLVAALMTVAWGDSRVVAEEANLIDFATKAFSLADAQKDALDKLAHDAARAICAGGDNTDAQDILRRKCRVTLRSFGLSMSVLCGLGIVEQTGPGDGTMATPDPAAFAIVELSRERARRAAFEKFKKQRAEETVLLTGQTERRAKSRPCSVCGQPPGMHQCCPKCRATADGEHDIDELFGFRTITRGTGQKHQVPQPWCRSCRTESPSRS